MSPVRHVSSPRALTQTAPGERPPGAWRYSSHLALVLSGGGARGAYHVGVLAGLAERLPGLEFPILSGMSVGAINTFYLAAQDRKSTRLNSSHQIISYAVFCLKKKT